jgi:hypothetical protein
MGKEGSPVRHVTPVGLQTATCGSQERMTPALGVSVGSRNPLGQVRTWLACIVSMITFTHKQPVPCAGCLGCLVHDVQSACAFWAAPFAATQTMTVP